MTDSDQVDDFLIADVARAAELQSDGPPWYVLIVDDDESVHSISRVVLADLQFRGRPVELMSAYSGRGAAALLRSQPDIAVVLLDVVMEADDAGLRLVREIREEMGNKSLRIILRTGQPGQAPERRVIVDYDINDYKSKAELTAQKLFTSTIAALRSYADIVALERGREGLERLISQAPELFARRSLDSFARALLAQIGALIGVSGDSALIAPGQEATDVATQAIVAGTGRFSTAVGDAAETVLDADFVTLVRNAIVDGQSHTEPRLIVRPIRSTMRRAGAVLFVAHETPPPDNITLVDILCASVGVGLDNVHLHRQLLDQQAVLEDTVAARTRELAVVNRDLLATQAHLEEELRVAGTLQQSILPAAFPAHPRISGAALMRAARSIGGDFYDIFALDAERIGLVVADVSGKGVPAALFMVLVRTIFQGQALRQLPPAEAVAETNRLLLERNPLSLFVTMIYGILDGQTGRFTFCSGGHGMPYLCRADGQAGALGGKPSPLLGLWEDPRFVNQSVDLAPGDAVVLTTDGVHESCNALGETFGEARLLRALAEGATDRPPGLLGRVIVEVDRFSGGTPPADDLTCLVARWE